MRGTSGASLAAASERWEPVLRAAGAAGLALGKELFVVVATLDGSAQLRRGLTDPARAEQDKVALVGSVLAGADERVRDLVAGLARSRWAAEQDLADAVDQLGVDSLLAAAESRGRLETVEDEVFRLSRALTGAREVREALSDATVDPERRRTLIATLVDGRADPVTAALAEHATLALRGRRFMASLARYGERAAQRRRRLVAYVTSAAPLGPGQLDRLGTLLERSYGRAVQLNVMVDPAVVGGLRIQVGADVVDSTVLARLTDARRRLAS